MVSERRAMTDERHPVDEKPVSATPETEVERARLHGPDLRTLNALVNTLGNYIFNSLGHPTGEALT